MYEYPTGGGIFGLELGLRIPVPDIRRGVPRDLLDAEEVLKAPLSQLATMPAVLDPTPWSLHSEVGR